MALEKGPPSVPYLPSRSKFVGMPVELVRLSDCAIDAPKFAAIESNVGTAAVRSNACSLDFVPSGRSPW